MEATRVRVGPGRLSYSSQLRQRHNSAQSQFSTNNWNTSDFSPKSSSFRPTVSPVRVRAVGPAGTSRQSQRFNTSTPPGTLPYLSQSAFQNPSDVPPIQQRMSYPPTSPQSVSSVSANLHQYRRFVTTPSNSDLTNVLKDALQNLYQHRPADDLLYLIAYLRSRVAERDGVSNIDALEQAEMQRIKAENLNLKRHLSPQTADYAAMNEMLAVQLQKKTAQLDEFNSKLRKLEKHNKNLKRKIKRLEKESDAQATELLQQQWMRDLEPEQVENALRIVFTEADLDGNGLLSREEFQHLLQSSNLKISPQELDYMLQSVEIDEEGQIHYEEFMPTAYHLLARFQVQKNKAQKRKKRKERAKRKKQLKQEQIEEEVDDEVAQDFLLNTLTQEELETQLREIYAATDEDKNGLISADEMYTLLQEIEGLPPFDMKDVKELIASITGTHVGENASATFEEFVPVAFTVLKRLFLNETEKQNNGLEEDTGNAHYDAQEQEEYQVDSFANDFLLNELTPLELEFKLREIYTEADADKNGLISASEMKNLLDDIDGLPSYSMEDIKQLMTEIVGPDNDSSFVTFDEFIPVAYNILQRLFINAMKTDKNEAEAEAQEEEEENEAIANEFLLNQLSPDELERKLREVYEQADTDENGLVSTQEMFDLLNSVEGLPSINMDDVRALMAEIAGAGEDSSVVTFEQFIPVAFAVLKRIITTAMARAESDYEEAENNEAIANEFLLNQLSPDELERKLREVYEQADTDENGLVSTQEMFDLLNSVEGLPSINMDDVRALMAEIAGAGEDSSVVTFEQFIPVAFTVLKRVITTALAHDKSEEEEEEGEDVNELAGEYLLNSMTPEELELKLREIYNETDVDGNGLISADEMLRLLTSVDGLPDINIENVYVLMSQIAGPGNDASLVTFNQFAPIAFDVLKQLFINQMMKEEGQAIGSDNDSVELSAETLETSILELFQETDLDENGLIDAEELHELLRDIPGVNADIEKCKNFVQHLDDNGDGRLNIKEFAPIAYELLLAATEADAVAMVHA